MIKKAIITVDLGFGDAGKGATVDYLVREHQAKLVVRYCGGAQAAHNVVLPDGRSHTFSQFGAGHFAGAATYLTQDVLFDPIALRREERHLDEIGFPDASKTFSVHPRALVVTPYHKALNRIREVIKRHGSCGMGIGECRRYYLKHGKDAIFVKDLTKSALHSKLKLQAERAKETIQTDLSNCLSFGGDWGKLIARELELIYDTDVTQIWRRLSNATRGLEFQTSPDLVTLSDSGTAILEGSQGVLLDEWHGFHPHTTWNTVTTKQAVDWLTSVECADVTTLGIMRAYQTRHGNGPFPTYIENAGKRDEFNTTNQWQGFLRAGSLDLPLTQYAIEVCEFYGKIDGLVVNHLDQPPLGITTSYLQRDSTAVPVKDRLLGSGRNGPVPSRLPSLNRKKDIGESLSYIKAAKAVDVPAAEISHFVADALKIPVVLEGHGPTHADRRRI